MANELHKTPSSAQLEFIGYRKNECSNDHTDKTEIDDAHHHGGEVRRIRGSDPQGTPQEKLSSHNLEI
jgi:hypothetical protein